MAELGKEHLCENLERTPRRLSAVREEFLREYPRHYVAGDTVHELLSEVDFLRAQVVEVQRQRDQALADFEKLDEDMAADLRFKGKLMGLLAAARGLLREYDNTREPEHQRRINEAAELVMVETRRIEEASHG
jgi:hypothetical protein